jgi:hypothetical protein
MESYKSIQNEYSFEEFYEIEGPMIELVKKLKDNIDNKSFDTILGDDIGGRIPTLVLNEVYKTIHPTSDLKTRFIAGGYYFPKEQDQDYKRFEEYLKKILNTSKNILFVTQYVRNGITANRIMNVLKSFGKNVSLATLAVSDIDSDGLYFGTTEPLDFSDENKKVNLVQKYHKKDHPKQPYVFRVFEIKGRPITDKQKIKIGDKLKKSREDVKKLAEKVVQVVWGK